MRFVFSRCPYLNMDFIVSRLHIHTGSMVSDPHTPSCESFCVFRAVFLDIVIRCSGTWTRWAVWSSRHRREGVGCWWARYCCFWLSERLEDKFHLTALTVLQPLMGSAEGKTLSVQIYSTPSAVSLFWLQLTFCLFCLSHIPWFQHGNARF